MASDNSGRAMTSTKSVLVALSLFGLVSLGLWGQTADPQGAGLALIAIHAAGGSIVMGDGTFGPKVSETISYDYAMSKYPVTNAEFARFIADGGYTTRSYWTAHGWAWKASRTGPQFWNSKAFGGPERPVVGVSWYEAVAFCNWLSVKEGLTPAYDDSGLAHLDAAGYRLPTEVEWEYASAKGAPDQPERIFPWGDTAQPQDAVSSVPPAEATATEDVGSRSPQGDTPQGLADMSGNIWEWCSDNFQGDPQITSGTDRYYFVSDSRGERFSLHGGSWVISFLGGLRTRFRNFSSEPDALYNVVGFRVVRR